MLAHIDHSAVAAFGADTRLESVLLIVVMALSSSLMPFIAQNLGAGQPHRAKEALLLSIKFIFYFPNLTLYPTDLFSRAYRAFIQYRSAGYRIPGRCWARRRPRGCRRGPRRTPTYRTRPGRRCRWGRVVRTANLVARERAMTRATQHRAAQHVGAHARAVGGHLHRVGRVGQGMGSALHT